MAEESNIPDSKESNGNAMRVIGIIVGMLILGVVAYLILNPVNNTEETNQQVDEQAVMDSEKENEMMDEKDEMSEVAKQDSTKEEVTIVKARAEAIRPLLTTDGVKSLDLILVFVDQNPTAVLAQKTEYPEAVQDAIDAVQSEIKDALATGIATKANTKTIQLKNGETVEITEGEEYDVTGVLTELEVPEEEMMMEEDEDGDEDAESLSDEDGDDVTPLGNPYVLTLEDGSKLYFIFNDENAETISEGSLLGEEVDMTVKVTEVNEETNTVSYQVVSGPTAAVESTE